MPASLAFSILLNDLYATDESCVVRQNCPVIAICNSAQKHIDFPALSPSSSTTVIQASCLNIVQRFYGVRLEKPGGAHATSRTVERA
jgi:hypothetical protein